MKMNVYFSAFLSCIFIVFLSPQTLKAQNDSEDSIQINQDQQKKQQSFFNKAVSLLEFKNKAAKQNDSTRFISTLVFSPGINFRPATSWGFGTGLTWTFRFKNSSFETRSSTMRSTASYTLKNQVILMSRFIVFFEQ